MEKHCCDKVNDLVKYYRTNAAAARKWAETLSRRGDWCRAERELILAHEWEVLAKDLEFILLTPHDAAYYARPR